MDLILGTHRFNPTELLIMAIVNRTPDSFYDKGASFSDHAAMGRVEAAIEAGAHIIDIGGVKAGPGETVDAAEEIRRTASFVEAVRTAFPDVIISVDTWRAEVGRIACSEGADLLNDAGGAWDPELAEVAAEFGVGLVCTHTGGAAPRTRPHRVAYDDVVDDAVWSTVRQAQRAVDLGVPRESILIDPGHDFGKNSYHSLQLTRSLGDMVATGWPVLVSLSNKDFVGEALDKPVDERLIGTLATTSISAWLGARAFRVHNISETQQTLAMVPVIRGDKAPAVARRGLA